MKPSCLIALLIPFTCPAASPEAKTPDRLASLRAAATAFYAEIQSQATIGLPSEENLKRLEPLVTPELHSLIRRARARQERQIREHPDEKPEWVEGNLFGSLFEGVTGWELGEAFHAPGVDATVKVALTYTEPDRPDVVWQDTLVFKRRGPEWLLDNIRMGGEWAFKAGVTLRGRLPGGGREEQDHTSPDERWRVAFTRKGDAVTRITLRAADGKGEPRVLFGGDPDQPCPFPTWLVWSPDADLLALRLGDGPRFTRTRIYRLAGADWREVAMPEFYPEEKKTMAENGFKETDRLVDAEHWHDARTLVVKYFGSFTKGDEGDGYAKFISVRIDPAGQATVVDAVDMPGDH